MTPTDLARTIWIKRGMASLLYSRKRQLDGQPAAQEKISQRIAVLNRQANECERKLERVTDGA